MLRVITAKDIPGENSFTGGIITEDDEELLASNRCDYYGQPLAIVVAGTQRIRLFIGVTSIL